MKKQKHLIILISLITYLSLQACEYLNYVNKESEIVTIKKTIEPVNNITVDASCRILLTMDDVKDIFIEGQLHLVENFEIDFENGVLNISHKTNTLQKKKLVEITVPAKNLHRITCNKPCEITNIKSLNLNDLTLIMHGSSEFTESDLNIKCNKLRVHCYGNTNIGQHTFQGETNELIMRLEGRIKVNALGLLAQKASFVNKSSYDSYLKINNQLNVNTYSSGNTYYKGTPEINHQRHHVPYLNSTGEVLPYK